MERKFTLVFRRRMMANGRPSNPFLQTQRKLAAPGREIREFNEALSALRANEEMRSGKLGPELANLQEYLDAQTKDEQDRLRKQELVRTLERARELVAQISRSEKSSQPGLESRLEDLEDLIAN